MLIISEEAFLKELAQAKSQSLVISEKNNEKDKEDSSEIESEVTPPSDEALSLIRMENKTYDEFRKKSLPNIPKEVRSIIGALASEEKLETVADLFNVSKDTVGDLVNDKHNNATVSEIKNNILERVKANTLAKLETCVDFLTVTRDMKASEHIHIAEGLARIHEKLTPKEVDRSSETKFIFYTPERQNKIEDYDVVDAVT